jgi:hypothetical protein
MMTARRFWPAEMVLMCLALTWGVAAWTVVCLVAVLTVLGILSIGLFIAPIAGFLGAACSVRQARRQPV